MKKLFGKVGKGTEKSLESEKSLEKVHEEKIAKIVYQAEIASAIHDGKAAKTAHDAEVLQEGVKQKKERW